MHAFFRFFWRISLISSRWACEVEPQELAWVGCSKPSWFARFWAGSGCGGLAGRRAWGALGASPGASGGLSGARRDPQGGLQRRLWQLLGDSGDLWGSLGASAGLWGALGVSAGTLKGFPRWSESFAVLLLCPTCSQILHPSPSLSLSFSFSLSLSPSFFLSLSLSFSLSLSLSLSLALSLSLPLCPTCSQNSLYLRASRSRNFELSVRSLK